METAQISLLQNKPLLLLIWPEMKIFLVLQVFITAHIFCLPLQMYSLLFSFCCLPKRLVSVGFRPLGFPLGSAKGEPWQEVAGRGRCSQGIYSPAASLLGCLPTGALPELSPELL